MQTSRTASTLRTRSYAPLHLPNLNHVELSEKMHLMLPFIAAPKLAHIVLSGSREGDPAGAVFVSLLGFLDAVGSNLVTALDIRDITGASALNLVRCIEKLPRLKSFIFVECIEGVTAELMGATTLRALGRTARFRELSDIHVCYIHHVPATTINAWYDFEEWRTLKRIYGGDVVQEPLRECLPWKAPLSSPAAGLRNEMGF